MFSRKIFGIMIILLLAAGIAITTTRCYDDKNEARVTIHLERNDLAAMGIQPQKHFIDRVLEFFSTPAEAGGWNDDRTDLTLTVTSDSFDDLTFSLPSGAETFSTTVPSRKNITFTITNYFDTMGYGYQKGWGGHTTIDLGPGDTDIEIKMIPMTWIISAGGSTSLDVAWYSVPYVTTYNIYRSLSPSGPFVLLGTRPSGTTNYSDATAASGVTYYYSISITNSNGEGVMCDPYSGTRM